MNVLPGDYAPQIVAVLDDLSENRIPQRIWEKDYTVWRPIPDEIANRLGWLDAPAETKAELGRLTEAAGKLKADGVTKVLLLGMGGSSLCPEVLSRTFGSAPGYPTLDILDSTHPDAVKAKAAAFPPAETVYVVASKSGTTVEPLSFFKYFYNLAQAELGTDKAGSRFIAITDPGSYLAGQAEEYGFRDVFLNNPDIGGRYSALSFFGMVPAALMGLDVAALLNSALDWIQASRTDNQTAYVLGGVMGAMARIGRDKLTLLTKDDLTPFGDWVEQLIAESTGKDGTGLLPVLNEPRLKPSLYGRDRLFVHLKLKDDSTDDRFVNSLAQRGHPVLQMELENLYELGGQMVIWELATAAAGYVMGIQPFDQPNVESAKILAKEALARLREQGDGAEEAPLCSAGDLALYSDASGLAAESPTAALEDLFGRAAQGGYVAVQAYLAADEKLDAGLARLREAILAKTGLAVTIGYGPRFLHSTGQLHKGDAGRGAFLQLTDHPRSDLAIPDQAGAAESTVSFGQLLKSQYLGDGRALTEADRPVVRVDLGADPAAGLAQLVELIN